MNDEEESGEQLLLLVLPVESIEAPSPANISLRDMSHSFIVRIKAPLRKAPSVAVDYSNAEVGGGGDKHGADLPRICGIDVGCWDEVIWLVMLIPVLSAVDSTTTFHDHIPASTELYSD